ncbi:hypothetical protein KAR10_00645, partial [bacterium]|nr:hypothetical protein [bacterium]
PGVIGLAVIYMTMLNKLGPVGKDFERAFRVILRLLVLSGITPRLAVEDIVKIRVSIKGGHEEKRDY